jgi:hypothetical protein
MCVSPVARAVHQRGCGIWYAHRVQLRRHYRKKQESAVEAVQHQGVRPGGWTPDDVLRFQSFLFALFRALDKVSVPFC